MTTTPKDWVKDLRTERALAGKCPGCGKPDQAGWCATCRDRGRRNQTTRRERMRAVGLCVCGRPPKKGLKSCVECITAAVERKRRK